MVKTKTRMESPVLTEAEALSFLEFFKKLVWVKPGQGRELIDRIDFHGTLQVFFNPEEQAFTPVKSSESNIWVGTLFKGNLNLTLNQELLSCFNLKNLKQEDNRTFNFFAKKKSERELILENIFTDECFDRKLFLDLIQKEFSAQVSMENHSKLENLKKEASKFDFQYPEYQEEERYQSPSYQSIKIKKPGEVVWDFLVFKFLTGL